MTRFTRTILIAGFALGTTLASVANLQAGCGGGGGYRPYYPSYPRPSYHQPVYQPQGVYQPPQQPVFQQPQQGFQQPQQSFQQPGQQPQQGFQQPQQQPAQQAPQTQPAAPATPKSAPATQSQAPSTPADAQMTALQALAEMTGQTQPQTSAAPAPVQTQASGIAGNWTARLGNGSVVQLTLQADGRFNWSATNKDGKTSSFQGSYNMAGGSLTLTRTDSRKLEGTMTPSGSNAFNFKLAGANDNGLDFVRG